MRVIIGYFSEDSLLRAAYLEDGEIRFRPDYKPRPLVRDAIEVEVLQAGICETDLQLRAGYMGFTGVPGHEFVGIAKSGRYQGQRVVGEINCACGVCRFCSQNLPRHCVNRTVIGILNHDGAFADSVSVPEENLHPVPDHLSTAHAVFTEPVAAACRILEQVDIRSEDRVVILGDGRLGNLSAQVLSSTGCRLTVVGKHAWKLNRLSALGMDVCQLADFQPAADATYVVDCTGSPSGFETAIQAVSPLGTIIQKTTVAAPQSLHLAPVVIDEVKIIGSRCGPFIPALEMLADGQIEVDSLISAQYALPDVEDAFLHAVRPDTLKVLLTVGNP